MGIINYKDIDFKKSIDKELKKFEFNGSELAVVPYLPIAEKYDFVMVTLQKSFEKGIYNSVKLDMYFDLHLIYMYTDIVVDSEDRADETALYDIFTRSGLVAKVKELIPGEEIALLKSYIEEMKKVIMKYRNTFGSVFGSFLEQFPTNMEKAKEILNSIDPEKIRLLAGLANLTKDSNTNLN